MGLTLLAILTSTSCGHHQTETSVTSSRESTVVDKVDNLHQVDVQDRDLSFIRDGKTDYFFVVGEASGILKAVNFCNQYFLDATGVSLPIRTSYENYVIGDKAIIFGRDDLWEQAGLVASSENLDFSGYQIETSANAVFVRAEKKGGYHMGAIALLKAILGYEMYSLDTVAYSKTGENLPTMHIVEKPDFAYRHYSNTMDPGALYGMGYTDDEVFIPISGWSIHNTLEILPPSLYLSDHPDWYETGTVDICYTAHGNAEEYKAMIQQIAENIIPLIDARPDMENFVISQEDNPTLCDCEACLADLAKYGSKASSQIKLLNAVDDLIQAHLNGSGRNFNLVMLAYHESERAPVKEVVDEKGNITYEPTAPEMLCHEHVGVEVAPINADYTTSFADPKNKAYADNMASWKALTSKLYVYAYETNFRAALYPYNSWSYVYDSFKYYYQQNAVYVFNSGQVFQSAFTGFTYLKDYLDARALFDVNRSYEEDVNQFFSYYFRDAEQPMREFYEAVRAYLNHLKHDNPELNGSIYDVIDSVNYWPKGILDVYEGYIERAYQTILPLKAKDSSRYEVTYRHILLESIFPRYALATLYQDRYSASELAQRRSSLVEDCHRLGITRHKEHESIENVFSEWGYGQ